MNATKPKLWVPGDWNAFFGFGTNILVNLLTLTALLRFVLKMPDELVFGRILPATGLMLFLSTVYYAWLAYRLAKTTGRDDVCALPSGISVPHMFVVTFVIMLPITLKTGDPVKGWEAGLTWVFIQSFVLMIGGFLGPWIRKITPRAALLGTLAGVSVTFISMRPALEMFLTPVIGLTCFAIILLSWFGGVKFRGIPAGLIAIAVGTAIAWGSTALGLNYGGLSLKGLADSVTSFGFHVPMPVFGHVFSGFEFLGVILVTAIPFGIYDLVEAIDNVESAAVAGDSFPTTRVLTADGVVSLVGCMMGNPFINAVYIGHPGWKAMGGRIGYSAATGIMVILLCWFGTISVMLALIPAVAILPILLYIAMLIGSQAFQETPRSHAPAVVLSLVPHMAAWAMTLINGALAAAGTIVPALGPEQLEALVGKMKNEGVLYHGLQVLGGGSILGGLILGAIAAFIIDRDFKKAAGFALAGAILTYFGFMHGERIGLGQSPVVAVSYAAMTVIFLACAKFSAVVPSPATTIHEPSGHGASA
ncbi:MAG: regulator [Verrucomicrobiales bacterium]|nr:regulator [Verrucomicrobiales bacterium]